MSNKEMIYAALEKVRVKLLDLSGRNRLLNFRETKSSTIRIVDELPDEVYRILFSNGDAMRLLSFEPKLQCEELTNDELLESLPPKEYKLQPEQASFIINRVRDLGSKDAGRQQYPNNDSPVRRYAWDVMESLYGEGTGEAGHPEVDVDIILPEANGELAEKHMDDALQTPYPSKQLERRCKKVFQDARRFLEETGINLLYVAIGFLQWVHPRTNNVSQAPLVLIPLEIVKYRTQGGRFEFRVSYSDEDIETNLSLSELLERDFHIALPEFSQEEDTPEEYFRRVAAAVEGNQGWEIRREMVIGFFSFAKLRLYKDLDRKAWPGDALLDHPTVQSLLSGESEESPGAFFPESSNIDNLPEAQELPLVLPADSSQHLAALNVVKGGRDTVIHGPPGTGKSQTITNIIAAALNEQKSVLFVAEKKAALEVVRSRLDEVGLGDFCLELHSHKVRKARVHEDLGKRLAVEAESGIDMSGAVRDLKRERTKLLRYYSMLGEKAGSAGYTVHEALWAAHRWKAEVEGLDVEYRTRNCWELTRDDLESTAIRVQDFATSCGNTDADTIAVWKGVAPTGVIPDQVALVEKALHAVSESTRRLLSQMDSMEFTAENLAAVDRLAEADMGWLETVPGDIHQEFAAWISDRDNARIAEECCAKLLERRSLMTAAGALPPSLLEENEDRLRALLEASGGIGNCGLACRNVGDLRSAHKRLEELAARVAALKEQNEAVASYLVRRPRTVSEFSSCLAMRDHLEKAPERLALHAHANHALSMARTKFEELRDRRRDFSAKLDSLDSVFQTAQLPETAMVREWASRLSGASFLAKLFSPSVRDIKKKVGRVLRANDLSVWDTPPKLLEAADLIDQKETWRADEDAQVLLGPLYKGLDSDWETLGAVIAWGGDLAKALGSEAKAKGFLADYLENKEVLSRGLEQMASCFQSVRDACGDSALDFDWTADIDLFERKIAAAQAAVAECAGQFSLSNIPDTYSLSELRSGLKALSQARGIERSLQEDPDLEAVLKQFHWSFDSDLTEAQAHLNWRKALGALPYSDYFVPWATRADSGKRNAELEALFLRAKEHKSATGNLFALFEQLGGFDGKEWFGQETLGVFLEALLEKVTQALAVCPNLIAYGDYMALRKGLLKDGHDSLVALIERENLDDGRAKACFRHGYFTALANEIFQRKEELRNVQGLLMENCRNRFKKHDERFRSLNRRMLRGKIAGNLVPQGTTGTRAADFSELSLIIRELNKKKRHIPIRQLVHRAGHALQALKPCFMMSPMSVAQYLAPKRIEFDMVVMDEASQLRVEDALGAVARGTQTVVVGDPNQLPPTNFFNRVAGGADDEEEGIAEDMESVLDLAVPFFNNTKLKWHYRSVHESLIQFSNSKFYGDELVFFPSAAPEKGDAGVFRHYVKNGVFKGRKNRQEAWAVSRAIAEHFRSGARHSLGVATFNLEQRDLIQQYLDKIREEDPLLDRIITEKEGTPDSLFIKNLENVQGDERDVIFISTTYGPDTEGGRVMQRFGPINSAVGWRRLNVIITRAKQCLHVFTSMRSSDILVKEKGLNGVAVLHDYLEFLENGRITERGLVSDRPPDSDFEIAVAKALNAHGFQTAYQVGVAGFFIDIGVLDKKTGSRYLLGVECDGATYHSTKSARDRDILRQEILQSRGWEIHRVWSTDWFKNPDREVRRIIEKLHVLEKVQEADWAEEVFPPAAVDGEPSVADLKPKKKKAAKVDKELSLLDVVTDSNPPEFEDLRTALVEYRDKKLPEFNKDISQSLLSDTMIDLLCEYTPTDPDSFRNNIPLKDRENVKWGVKEFGDELFELIADFE